MENDASVALAAFALFTLVFVIVVVLYFIPTIVAFRRDHPNKWPILLVNFTFGWAVVGWIGSLIWAMNAVHTGKNGNNGGESGLNIFANDVKPVMLTQREPYPDLVVKLTQIKNLYDQGVITLEEFEALKQKQLAAAF